MKAWMSSNFVRIPPLTSELAAFERLKKVKHSSAFFFDWIFFIHVGMEDNHNISDDFEIRQDSTTDCGVSCP